MITCDITLKIDGEIKEPKEIINDVFVNCNNKIEYIDLDLIRTETKTESGRIKVRNSLNASKVEIENFPFDIGIYFILSEDKSKLLYIGQALDVKSRLKAHLIKKAESVSSEMFKINEYLINNKSKIICYYAIETTADNNAAIEGALIDYAIKQKNNGDKRFTDLFNERKD